MLVVKGICIPRVCFGRKASSDVAGGIFLRSSAEGQWAYLSFVPKTFSLDDLWEKSSRLQLHCGDPSERLGG